MAKYNSCFYFLGRTVEKNVPKTHPNNRSQGLYLLSLWKALFSEHFCFACNSLIEMQLSFCQCLDVACLPKAHGLEDRPEGDSPEVAEALGSGAPTGVSPSWVDDTVSQSGSDAIGIEKKYWAVYAFNWQALRPSDFLFHTVERNTFIKTCNIAILTSINV